MTFRHDVYNVLFTDKFPTEAVVRYLQWAEFLITVTGTTDPIATSTWTGQTGITITNTTFNAVNSTTQALFSGGTAGQIYKIINTITTTGGQTLARAFEFRLKQP